MTVEGSSPQAAAVAGLVRSDPHGPGLTRVRDQDGFRYQDPSGAQVTDAATLDRIRALRIPPAWEHAWISPDPLGHIQATGVDSKGRLQYLYHQLWRELRDAQKFGHMLRFADALPALRTAAVGDLKRRGLTRERVVASVVRLIDLGLFRIGGERYAELDHHYGATTLRKQHVRVTRDGVTFDYVAKAGKRRTIVISDELVVPTVRALVRSDNGVDTLWCYQEDGAWHILHSRDVSNYIARRAGGHFTAKEFRTWHATVLMALALANAGSVPTPQGRQRVVAASVKQVAQWLGDTPAVARGSYIDPRLISHYESEGELATVPVRPAGLPVPAEVESAVAALLAGYDQARTAEAPLTAARRTLCDTERTGRTPRFFHRAPVGSSGAWHSTGMDSSRYLECLAVDYGDLRDAAAATELTAAVLSCPGWTMADLVYHLAEVYLHKVTLMRTGEEPEQWPPAALKAEPPLAVLGRAYGALRAEFRARGPGLPALTWYDPDQTVAFWIRRMAQETVIHRIDAEQAAGLPVTPEPADLAVDGVDEVLTRFLAYGSVTWPDEFAALAGGHLATGDGQDTITVAAGETAWTVRPSPHRVTVQDGAADNPRAVVEGPPGLMLRWLWGRAGDDAISTVGDPAWADYLRRMLVAVTQ